MTYSEPNAMYDCSYAYSTISTTASPTSFSVAKRVKLKTQSTLTMHASFWSSILCILLPYINAFHGKNMILGDKWKTSAPRRLLKDKALL
jgi:hypothetical protein